jgi:hypothetical protein
VSETATGAARPMQKPSALTLLLFLSASFPTTATQQAVPPPPASQESPPQASEPQAAPKSESSSGKKSKHVPGYLIIGTIWTEKAMAYPNVKVQVRRENEKRFKWETYTNSRGEFAIRVPDGQEYEVVVKEKNYKEYSLKLNANNGEMEQRLSVRLEKTNPEKDGAAK